MKSLGVLIVLLLLVVKGSAQPNVGHHGQDGLVGDGSYAPVLVFTNGGGRVLLSFPFNHGGMFKVGQTYEAMAIPEPGYVFTGWNPVNVFISIQVTVDSNGKPNPPTTSTVLSPVPQYYMRPLINLTVEPEDLIYDLPGIETIAQDRGWQANFVRLSGRGH